MPITTRREWKRPGATSSGAAVSISLAGSQTVADGDADPIEFDTVDEGAATTGATVTDIGTVPAGAGIPILATREHWINGSIDASSAANDGGITLELYRWDGAASEKIVEDVIPAGASSTSGILSATKVWPCVLGDVVFAVARDATGATVTLSGPAAAGFLQVK